jgi:aminoglycoside 6'-N-acetyltransferase
MRFDPISAERLLLRPFRLAEAAQVIAYRRDPAVARYQGWGVVDPGEIERDLADMTVRVPCDRPGPWFELGIVVQPGGAIVGDLGVRVLTDAPDTAEIGYTVAPAFQNRGYATEAVGALCDWLLGERGLARVIAIVDGRNIASIAVAERTGFARIACFETRHQGTPSTLLTYERRARPHAQRVARRRS